VAKQEIKAFVVKAIEKGADLRAIKHAYDNRNLKFKSLREIFNDMNGFYAETVPLSIILEDIRTDKYVFDDASGPDTQLIDSIIEEHLAVNPFDALEDAQKDYFENIRLKLADNYSLVRLEVDKLASELHNKNSLVNKYLKDSTKSFWISITALAFSLLIGILQLFLHRAERTKAIVASIIRSDRGKR
jgi:Rad3-related DNA helicase